MNLREGKGVKLTTIYAGRPAPGGVFYPASMHYAKVCKNASAGRHPATGDLGGIDIPIIEELKRRGCKTMELELSNGRKFFIPFGIEEEAGIHVKEKIG